MVAPREAMESLQVYFWKGEGSLQIYGHFGVGSAYDKVSWPLKSMAMTLRKIIERFRIYFWYGEESPQINSWLGNGSRYGRKGYNHRSWCKLIGAAAEKWEEAKKKD